MSTFISKWDLILTIILVPWKEKQIDQCLTLSTCLHLPSLRWNQMIRPSSSSSLCAKIQNITTAEHRKDILLQCIGKERTQFCKTSEHVTCHLRYLQKQVTFVTYLFWLLLYWTVSFYHAQNRENIVYPAEAVITFERLCVNHLYLVMNY